MSSRTVRFAAAVAVGGLASICVAQPAVAGFTPAAGSPVTNGVWVEPFQVAIGDLNADSDPDLAVTNQTSATVSILLGDGEGGFSPAAGSPVGSYG